MNAKTVAIPLFFQGDGVIKVFGIRAVDGENHLVPQVKPAFKVVFLNPAALKEASLILHGNREGGYDLLQLQYSCGTG